jgi:tRNA(Arg) A34 adenosine deaminase TadA
VSDDSIEFSSFEEKMNFVCSLAEENVLQKTGGPFGAGIFNSNGHLISAGINLVEFNNCSMLHAEMVAIILAQKKLGRYDLSNGGKENFDLVSSTEPCAMCFGAVPWSGVSRLVCGARDADARAIGFDEGPKLEAWKEELEKRNINVYTDVLRSKAVEILNLYVHLGGIIYNAGSVAHVS